MKVALELLSKPNHVFLALKMNTKRIKPIERPPRKCHVAEGDDYPFSFCRHLAEAVEGTVANRKDDQLGIFAQPSHNMDGRLTGNRLLLFSGQKTSGIALMVCPFCGGKVMGESEAAAYRDMFKIL